MEYWLNLIAKFNGKEEFEALCRQLHCQRNIDILYALIEELYGEPRRYYHNLRHILFCLVVLESFKVLADDLSIVKMAIWFHDIKTTEDDSASIMRGCLKSALVNEAIVNRISELIIDTKHPCQPTTNDGQLIHDIDLIGLAEPWESAKIIGERVRLERQNISDQDFFERRLAFLKKLLQQPIFAHEHFKQFEELTRANLEREVQEIKIRLDKLAD